MAIAQANKTTTVVRMAVARFGSTQATPFFASRAVAAANNADSKDHAIQVMKNSLKWRDALSVFRCRGCIDIVRQTWRSKCVF
jgi:hypothetical protein